MNNEAATARTWLNEIHELESINGWRYRDAQNQVTLGKSYLARVPTPRLSWIVIFGE